MFTQSSAKRSGDAARVFKQKIMGMEMKIVMTMRDQSSLGTAMRKVSERALGSKRMLRIVCI